MKVVSSMTVRLITFPYRNASLSGAAHFPTVIKAGQTLPAIILVHGFVGSKVGEHRLFVKAGRYFSERGYIVFRFDFLGCGESDGDYKDVTVTSQVEQLQHALTFVTQMKEVDSERIAIIGHSLGGAVSSLTSSIDKRVRELVLWSPVARPYHDITTITGRTAVSEATKTGHYDYRGFLLSHSFFLDLSLHKPLTSIKRFKGNALIIHAEKDTDVPKENGIAYYEALKQRIENNHVDLDFIKKADHTFSSYSFEEELFQKSYNWLQNSLFSKRTKLSNIL